MEQPPSFDDEVRAHIEFEIEENLARGLTRGEAEAIARRKFGNVTHAKEEIWHADRWVWWHGLQLDLRHALRMLRRSPVFTTVALISLALGIGGNTALFSLVDRLMLHRLPVREPDRLHELIVTHRSATHNAFSYPDYLKASSGAFEFFEGVFGWTAWTLDGEWSGGSSQPVRTLLVTGDYFTALGLDPAAGRLLQQSDDSPAGARNAVLGHGFWQREFGSNAAVVGKTIRLSEQAFTVVGVMPAGFTGVELGPPPAVVIPMHAAALIQPHVKMLERTNTYWMPLMVRLKAGVTTDQIKPILLDRWPRLLEVDGPPPVDGWRQKLAISPGAQGVSGVREEFGYALALLMGLAAIVLLTSCANLANLLLLRLETRRREIAIRVAAGATSRRIMRQWLTESALLSVTGGLIGWISARWITSGLLLFIGGEMREFLSFRADLRTLLFCLSASVTTALLFGGIPAWRAARDANWRDAARGAGTGRLSWLGRLAILVQLAASLVLVTGAALFARSLQQLGNADCGFNRKNLALAEMNIPDRTTEGANLHRRYQEFLAKVRTAPGVEQAALSLFVPMSFQAWWNPLDVPGYAPALGERTTVYLNAVSPGYFTTLGIRLLAGREFEDRDGEGSPKSAIISASVARRYFGGLDVIGRKCSVGRDADTQNLTIIGVVANSKYTALREDPKDLLYVALYQRPFAYRAVALVRPKPGLTSAGLLPTLRSAGANSVWEYSENFTRALQQDRMLAILASIFGALGAGLALVGLYGTMAYSVSRRVGEMGIRLALGSAPGQIRWMVLKDAARLAGLGLAAGLPLAALTSRLIARRLFEVMPTDAAALILVTLVMAVVSIGSALVPAWRASRVPPAIALRWDSN